MKKHTVKVYSTPTCHYCVLSKEYLDNKGVEYENIDVSADRVKAMEMVQKSGQMGVPVVDIDGTILVGFQPKEFDRLLA
jgi:glutaredoxin 3